VSKASEWAAAIRQTKAERPMLKDSDGKELTAITDEGNCVIKYDHLSPEQARAVAWWILATFGEP